MKKRRIAGLLIAVVTLLLVGYRPVGSSPKSMPELSHSIISSGGRSAYSANKTAVTGTIGQPAVGSASGDHTALQAGYWYAATASGTLSIYLPLLLRSP